MKIEYHGNKKGTWRVKQSLKGDSISFMSLLLRVPFLCTYGFNPRTYMRCDKRIAKQDVCI